LLRLFSYSLSSFLLAIGLAVLLACGSEGVDVIQRTPNPTDTATPSVIHVTTAPTPVETEAPVATWTSTPSPEATAGDTGVYKPCSTVYTLTPEPALATAAIAASAAWNIEKGCEAIHIGSDGAEVINQFPTTADEPLAIAAGVAAIPGGPVYLNPNNYTQDQLYSVLLHEFGHVLGETHDSDYCVMRYDCYNLNFPWAEVY